MFLSATKPQRQQGAATLIVVSVLAIAMALVALTISNTGVMEQRISGNDLRAREAQEAAEAGLNYGLAWARKHAIPGNPAAGNFVKTACPGGNGCPPDPDKIKGSSTGENYGYSLEYFKYPSSIKVVSTAFPVDGSGKKSDDSLSARSETFIKQVPKRLFQGGVVMPPPWVVNGCVAKVTGNPNLLLLDAHSKAILTSLASINLDTMANAALLTPEQLLNAALKLCLDVELLGLHLGVNLWVDADVDGVLDDKSAEVGTGIVLEQAKNTDSFKCDAGDTHCAWNQFFNLSVDATADVAVDVGQVFGESDKIPCGPALSASVYVVNKTNPINASDIIDISGDCEKITGVDSKTIGAPNNPIILIVPKEAGCPKFNGGITIFGIVYFESQNACKANGWGGATIYGSVIWEGDVDKPNANSKFIEVDYARNGSLDEVFNIGPDDAVNLPGTWKDF